MAVILVDQSYKIEQTNHDTIIAATRGAESVAVRIDRRLKRLLLQRYGKNVGCRRIYIWLFAWGASEAIAELWGNGDIIRVDKEYEGSTQLVEDLVSAYLLKKGIKIKRSTVSSTRVGRHALADRISRMPWLATKTKKAGVRKLQEIAFILGLE